MNKNIKPGDKVSGQYLAPYSESVLNVNGEFKGIHSNGAAIIATKHGPVLVAPKSLRKLVKKKKPYDNFLTSKGFVFTKTPLGWIDEASKLEWMNEFKAGMNHYDSEKWAADQKMRLPTREEFIEAEKHGVRELPGMMWEGYWFWTSTQSHGNSDYAYGFHGASGYADGIDSREGGYSNVAARAVRKV